MQTGCVRSRFQFLCGAVPRRYFPRGSCWGWLPKAAPRPQLAWSPCPVSPRGAGPTRLRQPPAALQGELSPNSHIFGKSDWRPEWKKCLSGAGDDQIIGKFCQMDLEGWNPQEVSPRSFIGENNSKKRMFFSAASLKCEAVKCVVRRLLAYFTFCILCSLICSFCKDTAFWSCFYRFCMYSVAESAAKY